MEERDEATTGLGENPVSDQGDGASGQSEPTTETPADPPAAAGE